MRRNEAVPSPATAISPAVTVRVPVGVPLQGPLVPLAVNVREPLHGVVESLHGRRPRPGHVDVEDPGELRLLGEKSKERAGKRMKNSVEQEFKKSVKGYTSVNVESSRIDVKDGKVHYSLLPAWVLNTKYNKENYTFIMNGQSGRLVGKLPTDKGKFWKYTFMFTCIFGIIFTFIVQALRIFL